MLNRCYRVLVTIFILSLILTPLVYSQENETKSEPTAKPVDVLSPNTIFDDKMLLNGYAEKYKDLAQDVIWEMIKDDTVTSYRSAAAIRVFKNNFAKEMVGRNRIFAERLILRRINRDDSPFVQIEGMHALCVLDRYRYFATMVPALIQKLDHYNTTVNEIAFYNLKNIIETGSNRQREARIVFNTLNKVLFLSRRRLANIDAPGLKLKQKLELLRWSIKILGTQELKRLPKEVLNLL